MNIITELQVQQRQPEREPASTKKQYFTLLIRNSKNVIVKPYEPREAKHSF